MPQTQTTFTKHFEDSGSKNGRDWKRHAFLADDGRRYVTFDGGLGQQAKASLGKAIGISYSESDYNGRTNYTLESIDAVADVEHVEQAQPQQTATTTTSSSSPSYDARQSQINRSAGVARAIEAHNAGLVQLDSFGDIVAFAEKVKAYVENGHSERPLALAATAPGNPLDEVGF